MRLIDADTIKYRTISYGGWGQPDEVADKYEIDKMSAVDAIPVYWLKEKLTGHPELRYATTDGICEVLRLWSERNGDRNV